MHTQRAPLSSAPDRPLRQRILSVFLLQVLGMCLPFLQLGCTIRQGTGGTSDSDTPGQLPNNDYCQAVAEASWDTAWSTLEQELLLAINTVRAEGTTCGKRGTFAPTHAVSWSGSLTCAARVHAEDMGERDYFDHNSPEGETVSDRISSAGYSASSYGEILTAGHSTAASALDTWLESNDHCALLMEPAFTEAGVGWYSAAGSTYGTYQDVTFGTPKSGGNRNAPQGP